MANPLAFIIEDDRDLNIIFGIALKEAGFEIESFYNGPAALERMKNVTPDIITLDFHLPQMSGEEILKKIRSNDNLKQVRVILTTADHYLSNSLDIHVDHILIKPFSYKQLRDIALRLIP